MSLAAFENIYILCSITVDCVHYHSSLYNHHIFIRTFLDWDRKNKKELGWMCYAYMLIVEKSARHLENQSVITFYNWQWTFSQNKCHYRFPYEMMAHLNRIRNAANAFALAYTESNSTTSTFEYHERFQLDWNLFKGKTPSVEAKAKFHLFVLFGLLFRLRTIDYFFLNPFNLFSGSWRKRR